MVRGGESVASGVPKCEESHREGIGFLGEKHPRPWWLGLDGFGESGHVLLELLPSNEASPVAERTAFLGDDGFRVALRQKQAAEPAHPGRFSVMKFAMLRIEAKISWFFSGSSSTSTHHTPPFQLRGSSSLDAQAHPRLDPSNSGASTPLGRRVSGDGVSL